MKYTFDTTVENENLSKFWILENFCTGVGYVLFNETFRTVPYLTSVSYVLLNIDLVDIIIINIKLSVTIYFDFIYLKVPI